MDERRDLFSAISGDSTVLNSDSISENVLEKHSAIIGNRNYWHAFLIHNVKKPERNHILKIILDYVYPEALLPILFQSKGTDCMFLARNCSGAISILMKNKLVIPDPSDTALNYTCEIILNYATIEELPLPPNNITKILDQLYDKKTKTLHLENFSSNEELSEFTPLSQPKLLCFVLHLSEDMKPCFIKLNNNEIRTLSPFEVLRELNSVESLDLRNNSIADIEELNYLKIFQLTELWLDGNPVCGKYDEFSYIDVIKNIFPALKTLDGISIKPQQLPVPKQTYICDIEGFDLVDQFIKHFFTLYDTERELLVDLYHPCAIFSMTTEKGSGNEWLKVYETFSRNILDGNNCVSSVTTGNTKIANILCKLPKTKHYLSELSVDLIHYTASCAIISVSGAFYDVSKKLPDSHAFSFKRTFILKKQLSDYVICNEVLHIGSLSNQKMIGRRLKPGEKKLAMQTMSQFTGLHKSWIQRLLFDADFNITTFLTTFINLMKANKIPEQAYFGTDNNRLMEWLIPKMIEYGFENFQEDLQTHALNFIKKNPSLRQKYYDQLNLSEKSCKSLIRTSAKPGEKTNLLNSTEVSNTRPLEMETNYTEISTMDSNSLIVEDANESKEISQANDVNMLHKSEIDGIEIREQSNVEETFEGDEFEIKTQPRVAYVNSKWIEVQNHDEYDFHLAFKRWILVQKDKDGKFSLKQDDFQKNFTCWKKHFPTYSNEILTHSLNASCLKTNFKYSFDTIPFPVTYWDFPASVPYTIRPPKYVFLKGNKKQRTYITRGCGFGFLHNQQRWILVSENSLGSIEEAKYVWQYNRWFVIPLTEKEKEKLADEKATAEKMSPLNNKKATISKVKMSKSLSIKKKKKKISRRLRKIKNKILNSELLVSVKDLVIDSEELGLTEKLHLEKLKSIYAEDTESEKTITTSNLELNLPTNKNYEAPADTECRKTKDELVKNWKRIYEFVPYIPKLALIEGYWTILQQKSDIKLHKVKTGDWVLLEKNSENKWCLIKDDFSPDKEASTKEAKIKILGNNIFDHLPTPVTMYDFPSSIPSTALPPKSLIVGGNQIINVTPDSDYAFVSVRGQWNAVKKNEEQEWKAFHSTNETAVNKKLTNMPSASAVSTKLIEVDKKSLTTCTLLELIIGSNRLKPVTYWNTEGSEYERPPKLALTDINGKHQWYCVTPMCGKGFIQVDGVWVKVVKSMSGEWKATQYNAYEGCIVGYRLFSNLWVTMKKEILGGKWTPIFDLKNNPTTYWNYVGLEENKPPQQILIDKTYKTIHNNSEMGFLLRENAWILMERKDNNWTVLKKNQQLHIYKLVHGIWRTIEQHSSGKWSLKPTQEKMYTYMNFDGIKTHSPPKQITFIKGGMKIRKVIDKHSNMGFVMHKGIWILKQLKNGKMKPMKNSKGQTNFGFKRIGKLFVVVQMDERGEWIDEPKNVQRDLGLNSKLVNKAFQSVIPLTYDRIQVYVPEILKPPRYAMVKDLIKNKIYWRLIDEHSGYGFIQENNTWILVRWISDKNWEEASDEVEYRYKAIDNRWIPLKKENNTWVPLFNPKITPIVPQFCINSPETYLPDKITMNTSVMQSQIHITPYCDLGYIKIFDEYVLVRKMSNGKLILYEYLNNGFMFKHNHNNWVMSTPTNTLVFASIIANYQTVNIDEIKTYANTAGNDNTKPPRYIKMLEGGTLRWKEIDISTGFGFIKRTFWTLVKQDHDQWIIVNEKEAYHIIDNRWVLMKKVDNNWSPGFDPLVTPRCGLDSVVELAPIRVITYKDGYPKYINTAKDCTLGFKVEERSVYILMKKEGNKWIEMKDDLDETDLMAFKLVDCKWQRMKKTTTNEWITCYTQFHLPILHFDVIGEDSLKPPSHLSINDEKDRMDFNVFSDEGFLMEDGCWVLMKFIDDKWVNYPGIYGEYGFKSVDGKVSVFPKINGKWENPDMLLKMPILNPVTYKNIKDWDEKSKPPMDMLLLFHSNHNSETQKCCNYGFVKDKDVWIVIKKECNTWKLHKHKGEYVGYKLIQDRWATMKFIDNVGWKLKFDPLLTFPTYLDTFGKFEDRPPLRMKTSNARFKVVLKNSMYGFIKKNDKWLLMNKITKRPFEGEIGRVSFKIVDGKWTCFNQKKNSGWTVWEKPILPVLSCDFVPGHKNAPPSSLCFKNIKLIDVGPFSPKGFIAKNGAWILMEKRRDTWIKFAHFPNFNGTLAFMLVDNVWKTVTEDIDGSWKCISVLKTGNWFFTNQKLPPISKPTELAEIQNLIPKKRPPEEIVLFEDANPKRILLAHNKDMYGFRNFKDAWVLVKCKKNGKWKIAGGLVAYKRFNDRWVTMKFHGVWKPTYNPEKTPITYFEVANLNKPPLRIVLNENGIDMWKVILQHSGYGFTKTKIDGVYVLMEKQCDGNWKRYKDFHDKYIGYRNINLKWCRFKQIDGEEWKRDEPNLPCLPCDFSRFTSAIPPSLSSVSIKDTQVTSQDVDSCLQLYSKYGFSKQCGNIWVLMECDSLGNWSEHKIYPNQKGSFGYKFEDNCWKFMKKLNNNWIQDEIVEDKLISAVNIETVENIKIEKYSDKHEENSKHTEVNSADDVVRDVSNHNSGNLNEPNTLQLIEVDFKKPVERIVEKEMNVRENGRKINVNEKVEVIDNEVNVISTTESEFVADEERGNVNNSEIQFKIQDNIQMKEEKLNGENITTIIKNEMNKCTDENGVKINEGPDKHHDVEIKTEVNEVVKIETDGEKSSKDNLLDIEIVNPVLYHQLLESPNEERPPRSVCLNIRGAPKRIPLNSKTCKIGFQHHNGVWVLLEKLSGVWKILRNSSGLPLAYKLIDQRWVSMRFDKNGSWLPTFNPQTTPRIYFETEGSAATKPPRRVVLEEDGKLKWTEIEDLSGLGFLKTDGFWVLMKKISNNDWIVYKSTEGLQYGFKNHDSKWTKYTKLEGGCWEIKDDNLPVLHYDFLDGSEAAPPELTTFTQKRMGKLASKIGFIEDSGAWVIMQQNEDETWTALSPKKTIFGFIRVTNELWDLVKKDENGQWVTVESKCEFESAFAHIFTSSAKRRRDSECPVFNKTIKIESNSPATKVKQELVPLEPTETHENPIQNSLKLKTEESTSLEESNKNINAPVINSTPNSSAVMDTKTIKPQNELKSNESRNLNSIPSNNLNGGTSQQKFYETDEIAIINPTENVEYTKDQTQQTISELVLNPAIILPSNNSLVENKMVKNRELYTSTPSISVNSKQIEDNSSKICHNPCLETNEKLFVNTDNTPLSMNGKGIGYTNSTLQESLQEEQHITDNEEQVKTASGALLIIKGQQFENKFSSRDQEEETNNKPEYIKNRICQESVPEGHEEITEKTPSLSTSDSQVENKEELNEVELYLASQPDCCSGCPELQNLLRQFRPANNPSKILRKRFRLPNGGTRMLTIPKALSVATTSSETKQNDNKLLSKKRALASGETINVKKLRYTE